MRGVSRMLALLLMVTLVVALVGCRGSQSAPGNMADYRTLMLTEGPAALKAYYDRMKAIPGLVVYRENRQTYVLVLAGRADTDGLAVAVMDVQSPPRGTQQPVRILARVVSAPGATGAYPYALLAFSGAEKARFVARLSTHRQTVLELPGLPLEEQ